MLVRSRRAAASAIGATLFAFATACTNPTAPSATPRNTARVMSGDGVGAGSSNTMSGGVGAGSSNAQVTMCGVGAGSSGHC